MDITNLCFIVICTTISAIIFWFWISAGSCSCLIANTTIQGTGTPLRPIGPITICCTEKLTFFFFFNYFNFKFQFNLTFFYFCYILQAKVNIEQNKPLMLFEILFFIFSNLKLGIKIIFMSTREPPKITFTNHLINQSIN